MGHPISLWGKAGHFVRRPFSPGGSASGVRKGRLLAPMVSLLEPICRSRSELQVSLRAQRAERYLEERSNAHAEYGVVGVPHICD